MVGRRLVPGRARPICRVCGVAGNFTDLTAQVVGAAFGGIFRWRHLGFRQTAREARRVSQMGADATGLPDGELTQRALVIMDARGVDRVLIVETGTTPPSPREVFSPTGH